MKPCSVAECTRWISAGDKCWEHTTDDELVATFARKPVDNRYNEDRLIGIGVVRALETRVTPRPNVGRVKPWTQLRGGTIPLSDTIVTKPDGTKEVWARGKRKPATEALTATERIRRLQQIATPKDHDTHNND